ncbi:uncharacterized protein LOC113343017 [Papaver somniferum]|uniref:uncharacterized protein LOC113343017 n=1 Tax=Papaver somniferum TaxID=3469 RepID=UPI000E6FF82B|nr:uncharacterized protein LOC113343017 [Papaver somniferum]
MAEEINQLHAKNGEKIPSRDLNPREGVNAITLASGIQLVQPKVTDSSREEAPKKPVFEEKNADFPQTPEVTKSKSKHIVSTYVPPLPFPGRFSKDNRKVEQDRDIWDVFKKVQVNIPLVEVIRQTPRYVKCVKELCTKKVNLTGNEVTSVGENASEYLRKKLPPKLKDPGSFIIPCTTGKRRFTKAMLDLAAFINVMPTSIYDALNLGPLKETGIVIQLADRSDVYPKDMSDVNSSSSTPLLLGRPFMSTARTKIDVQNGTLTMEFDEEVFWGKN